MEELIGWVLLAIFVVAAGRVGYLIYQNNRHPEQRLRRQLPGVTPTARLAP